MSSLNNIDSISNRNGNSGPVVSGISTFLSSEYVKIPSGTNDQKVGTELGSLRFNNTGSMRQLEFYNGRWSTIVSQLS